MLDRLARAWRTLHGEQRLAALAALALLVSLFLPWYEKSALVPGAREFATESVSAFGAFSFVEAAVLLVSTGVLVLLFMRAEGRAFHLPGGDGAVISAAGAWAALLIVWRMFDTPDVSGAGASVGIQWGVFVALATSCLLAYAGQRVRQAHRPEPEIPVQPDRPASPAGAAAPVAGRRRRRRAAEPPQSTQLFSPDAPPETAPAPEPSPAPAPARAPRPRRDFFPEPEPPEEAPPPPSFGR